MELLNALLHCDIILNENTLHLSPFLPLPKLITFERLSSEKAKVFEPVLRLIEASQLPIQYRKGLSSSSFAA